MADTLIAGPIVLVDKTDTSEKTGPQVYARPLMDSRVAPNNTPISYRCINELVLDPTCLLAELAITAQMIHTPWVYETNNDATSEMVQFVEKNLLPLRDFFLQQAVQGTLRYGWQSFEAIFKPEDGMIWFDCFKALLQEKTDILVFINNGRYAGVINQVDDFDPKILTNEYSFNINFDVRGTDWYGTSVYKYLQRINKSWDNVEKTSNRYDNKIAGATWVIHYPVGASNFEGKVDVDNGIIANTLLTRLEASGAIAVPDEVQEYLDDSIDKETRGKWLIELITAKGSGQSGLIDRQRYLDALKVRAFGLTERSLFEGSHGTKEEASIHTDISLSTIDTKHRLICFWLNWLIIPTLLKFNFGRKYMYSVRVTPAPLADNKFNTIKAIYHALIQNADPEQWEKIVGTLNIGAIQKELGLPVVGNVQNG